MKEASINDKNEAAEAIKRIDKIIQQWEEHWLDAREVLEMIVPDLKIVICYVERTQGPEEEES